ncbi:MAG: UrcA family protein [Hyphomonadaceae bacterium]|nr:UrcA family protein [Hyphomonadaceae bacterium]
MRTTTTLVLAATLTALAGVASAEPTSISVPFTQADLQSQEAIASLYERIEQAAERVCRDPSSTFYTTMSTCKADAIEDALERADIAPLLVYAETMERGAPVVEIAAR